jgi:predicted nuclease of predicted toxin-antitoxin system
MSKKRFHKHKLLLDENMQPRKFFPRLNSLFDIKHISLDLKQRGLRDEHVYQFAAKAKRLLVTFNGDDFKDLSLTSNETGVISLSENLPLEQLDKKLTALLQRSNPKALYGKFTTITGETKAA